MKRTIPLLLSALTLVLLSGCRDKAAESAPESTAAALVPLPPAIPQDTLAHAGGAVPSTLADIRPPDVKVRVRRGNALVLETEGLLLTAADTAVTRSATYSATALYEGEFPGLPQGMVNMTAAAAAYRLLPSGDHFRPAAELRVAYDPDRLPMGYTPDDIYTSFYDTASLAWVRLQRIAVDTANREIVSLTSHFTDFINELLKAPEMPETQAFVPTAMSDLEAVSPLAGYSTISPPVANNMGTASISYPIQIPAGRGEAQPHLELSYNSNGANGVCGVGWDLPLPCISVDTRWGVPLYDSIRETETYLYKGEHLLVAHDSLPAFARQYDTRNTNPTKRFYSRVEGDFDSILRHGTSPQNYWWEVFDRQGIRYIYGLGDGELRSSMKNAVAKWYLTRVIDRNGNTTRYQYRTRRNDGDGRVSGTSVLLDKISYSSPREGFPDSAWYGYSISFHYGSHRDDPVVSGNHGVKENIHGRLDSIKTWYVRNKPVEWNRDYLSGRNANKDLPQQHDSSMIRGYRLLYTYSQTGKSLLAAIVEMSPDEWQSRAASLSVQGLVSASSLKYHKFGYYPANVEAFGPPTRLATDIRNADSGLPNVEASPLGGSKSSNDTYNFSAGVGLGDPKKRTLNIEGVGSFSPKSTSEGTTAIIDINGDGYPDLLFRKNGLWLCQLFSPQENQFRPADECHVSLPTNGFDESVTKDNFSIGMGAHAGWEYENTSIGVNVGAQYSHSNSDITMYFSDVNADGKPDIVRDGTVWFNNSYGDTVSFDRDFIPRSSPNQPCETSFFTMDRSVGLDSAIFAQGRQTTTHIVWNKDKYDNYEDTSSALPTTNTSRLDTLQLRRSIVRVWIAPYNGKVRITGTAKLDSRFDEARNRTIADGVHVSIQHNGNLIPGTSHDITLPGAVCNMAVPQRTVVKGDRIYFRVEALENDLYDIVDWSPIVTYLSSTPPPIHIADGAVSPRIRFSSETDFLAWDKEYFSPPMNGTFHIAANYQFCHALQPNQNITLKIHRSDTAGIGDVILGSRVIGSYLPPIGSCYSEAWEMDIVLDTTEVIYFTAECSHDVNWSKLQWFPRITGYGSDFRFSFQDGQGNTVEKNGVDVYLSPIFPSDTANLPDVPVDVSVFGNLYRQWGHFVYNSDTMRTPIDESKISMASSFRDTAMVDNALDNVRTNYGGVLSVDSVEAGLNRILPNPDRADVASLKALYEPGRVSNRILVGFAARCYATPTQMSLYNWYSVQAALSDSTLLVPVTNQSIAASGLTAVGPVKGSYQRGVGVHASGGLNINDDADLNGCVNYSFGNNHLAADFTDFNGDGYPDAISETDAQYSNPWGGLSALTAGINPLGRTGIQTTAYEAFSLQGGASFACYKKNGKQTAAVHIQPRSVGLSGNVARSSDYSKLIWMDINGDGLPDCMDDNSQVAMNLGYSYYYHQGHQFPSFVPTKSSSTCFNNSQSLNCNLLATVNHSFTAGTSATRSNSDKEVMYVDMNGDGLVDKLVDEEYLYYNTGWGFSNTAQRLQISDTPSNRSFTSGYSAGITLGAPFLGFKAQGGAGAAGSSSASTTQALFLDINADGLPDRVSCGSDGSIQVRYNQLFNVDKLLSVQSFYGNRMDVSYAQADYSPAARQRPTVMAHLTVVDATLNSLDKREYRFCYRNYVHSVNERTAFGFDSVLITQYADGRPYRITHRHYRTDLYKMRGRLAKELVTDAGGRPYVEKEWMHRLKQIGDGAVVPPDRAHCFGATWPALDAAYSRHYNPQSRTVAIETAVRYWHADSGRVTKYINHNNLATPDDDVICEVEYVRGIRNQYALPVEINVTDSTAGEIFRRQSAVYDSLGRLAELAHHTVEHGNASKTNYTYDAYGNILSVLLPPNANGERPRFEYTYDSLVHMFRTRIVDGAFGDTSRTEYDVRLGRPLRVYSKGGDSISYTYDGWGRTRTIRAPQEHDTNGHPTIQYLYWDDRGSMAPQIANPAFRSFTGVRVLAGLLAEPECHHYIGGPVWAQTKHRSQLDQELDQTTVLFADGHGRVLQTRKTAVLDNGVQQVASGHVVYDDAGRAVKTFEPFTTWAELCTYVPPTDDEVFEQMAYDELDRVVYRKLFPEDIVTSHTYGYSNMGGVTHFLEETSDPEGRISYTYTDARGLTTNHIDALHGVTRFEYDALGQLRRTYDPDNFMTAYGYDNLGHLILRSHPDAGATQYAYDPAGNLIAEENPLGQIFYDYTYYRLAGKRYGNMSGNDVIYEYGTEGTATGLPVRINDGSGSLTLEYDAMGNVSKSVRVTSVPTSGIAFAFTHSFLYDSWGRMLQMTYPDGESVHYEYNRAGDLLRMYGEKNNHSRKYIDDIGYNKYGQRTYVDYGNGARTEYSYDPLRRLDRLRSRDAHNRILQEIGYSYDRVSNITQTRNTASVIDGMGGAFENNYFYDGLDRLVHASGDSREGRAVDYKLDEMRYSASGRVGSKIQWWSTEAGHGAQHLEYGYVASGEKPHAPRLIADHATDSRYGLQWDPAGNLIQVIAHGDAPAFAARFHYWTEDNRLHTVADDRSYSYYAYDHTGQRVLKLTGASDQLDINADFLRTHTELTESTLYPSPYIVLSNHGYTKHYYAGSERVAARIGGGNLDHDTACIVADEEAMERADRVFDWCLRQVKETAIAPLDLSSLDIRTIDGDRMDAPWWLDEAPTGLEAGLKLNVWKLLHAMDLLSSPSTVPPDTDDEPDVYFYHSDHLGSASWITEVGGKPVQHIQYLPYGEPFLNQRVGGYNERFTFTGKERDEETGYGYFGARYMDHELMTMWLSVDPLADKYPSLSPYNYCMWNPIKLVDPDGRDTLVFNKYGNYSHSIKSDGEHVGKYECPSGKPIVFTFADPLNDPNSIKKGDIKRVQLMKRDDINKILDNSKVFDKKPFLYISKLHYIANHSNASKNEGELDFMIYANLDQSTIYLVERAFSGGYRGHNAYNFGNFLWGASAEVIGASLPAALLGAHINNYLNDCENTEKKWYNRKPDSSDDQLSIRHGYLWGFRYAKKPS